ncbi:MAG: Ig-like domain-containing protein [Bacteroidota bacterium]|nr:Ig-like domain-containing protein [Bacteroidota bacterium]
MNIHIIKRTIIIFGISVLGVNCAGQFYPSGGPPDSTPPQIVETVPEENSLFFKGDRIYLKFSEYVEQRTVQEAVFISPDLGLLEFEWSGKELDILFTEKLRDSTTYVFSLGTDVKDRNGNRMEQAFSLAFSTAGVIDTAIISGKIFDKKPEGVTLFAYKLDNREPDTLNPQNVKPDYLTQTGNDGSFILKNLSSGTYRLFAIKDQYNNLLYDPQIDRFSCANSDIYLIPENPTVSNLKFQLAVEDTSSPFIVSASAIDRNNVLVKFSEPLDTSVFNLISFTITDTVTNNPLEINSFALVSQQLNAISLTTSIQDSQTYQLIAHNIIDTAGNSILLKNNFIYFHGTTQSDTTKPTLAFINISKNANDVPYTQEVYMMFSEPINRIGFENSFQFIDSGKVKVDGKFFWQSDANLRFKPSVPLQSKVEYSIKMVMDSIYDAAGNSIRDSVVVIKFTTVDSKKLGLIRGSVSVDSPDSFYHRVVVRLVNINNFTVLPVSLKVNQVQTFEFSNLPEGQYTIQAFVDENNNGKYDSGKIFPHRYSEILGIYPDTIKVRARWPIDGVNIKF